MLKIVLVTMKHNVGEVKDVNETGRHCITVFCDSDPLKTFLDKLGESQTDFEWIQHAVKGIRDGHVVKRDILTYEDDSDDFENEEEDENLTSFIETGDQWYEKFRENECRASKKKEYCHKNEARDQKLWEISHLDKAFEPKKFPKPIIPMKFDEDEEEEYDFEPYHKRQNDDLRTLRRNTLIESVKSERTSKNEQEMAANATNYEDSEEISEEKRRSINPSNEIKLKISNKLMHKGLGPSLPSYGYNDGQVLVYRQPEKDQKENLKEEKPDDGFVFPYKERDLPNYNLFKREQEDEKTENWSENDYPEYENDPKDEEQKFGRHLLSILSNNEEHRHHHKHHGGHKFPKKLEKEFDYDKEAKEIHVFGPKVATNKKCEAKYDKEHDEFSHKSEKIALKEPIFDDLPKENDKNDTKSDSTSPVVNIKVDFNSNSSLLPKNSTFAKIEIALSKSRRSLKEQNDQFSIKTTMQHLIENVHKSLDDDPELKNWISPHLMSRYDALHTDDDPSNDSKNEKSNDFRDKNLKDLSTKIERLIEKEVKSRMCAKLDPDMEAYYKKLVKSSNFPSKSHQNGRRSRSVDIDQLSSKYQTVQDLLHQFNSLPREEQQHLTSIKEMLDNHIRLLDELTETLKNEEISKNETISDRFERLSKAVTYIRKTNKP